MSTTTTTTTTAATSRPMLSVFLKIGDSYSRVKRSVVDNFMSDVSYVVTYLYKYKYINNNYNKRAI